MGTRGVGLARLQGEAVEEEGVVEVEADEEGVGICCCCCWGEGEGLMNRQDDLVDEAEEPSEGGRARGAGLRGDILGESMRGDLDKARTVGEASCDTETGTEEAQLTPEGELEPVADKV